MMLGVYLPTIQHILGLMMFIRHAWVVGCAGVLEGFAMVFMCCLTVRIHSYCYFQTQSQIRRLRRAENSAENRIEIWSSHIA